MAQDKSIVLFQDDNPYKDIKHLTNQTDVNVNHPPHYTQGKIEVIDFLEDQPATRSDPLLWQVVRYICRSPFKANQLEDLKKARWYLDRRITQLGGK